jgi:ATP-dependent Clp protease protease subunit
MPKIIPLRNKHPFEIRAKSKTKAEILIYGSIGTSWFEDSISAKQFSEELKKLDSTVNEIELRINSPGGDCFDGFAIANRIKQHPAKVTCYIDGLCASIATIIALAADEVVIGEGAQMMIHKCWTVAAGNESDFEDVIARLQSIDEQLITTYVKKTKMSRAEVKELVHAETWFNADEAIAAGFCDKKFEGGMPIAASALDKATWIHSKPTAKIKTDRDAINEAIDNLKNKVSAFIARK